LICFIVNPAAGSGRAATAAAIIERMMQRHGMQHSLVYTRAAGDFSWVAEQIDLEKCSAIACVGGDGTVQEYVGLAVGREISFAVIPAGSANDLLHSVPGSLPRFRTFEEKIEHYVEKLITGRTILADVISVNNQSCFFNIGGTGIDIQVLKDAAPLKKTFGKAAYFLSLVKNVAGYRPEKMTLCVDGISETGDFLLLSICNGAYYGGKLKIAPSASIDDGYITLCKVRKMPRLKLVALFPLVKPGRHDRIKEVSIVSCKEVRLEYDGRKTINFDGNLYELAGPLRFEVLKGAVRLVV